MPFGNCKYFVYRGILKTSLVNGLNIAAKNTITNTELITRIYAAREANVTTYTAEILGFDNNTLANTTKIDALFLKGINKFKAIHVQEGEWFGNFSSTHKIAFEVILECDKINLDLAFFRKGETIINIAALPDYDKRIKQEEILCFIDPAAFWGLYFYDGVRVSIYSSNSKSTSKKKRDELYTLLIAKYFTKNRVYLDIRSEHGYSYNMYQNYKDSSNNNIKLGNTNNVPIAKNYATNGWPILFIDNGLTTTQNKNNVIINLRIDDNIKPILYVEDLVIIDNPDDSYFIDEKKLLQNPTNTDWTNELTFKYPNTGSNPIKDNVAYHLKLTYYRQINNPNSPNTVLPKEEINDGIFGLDMPNLADGDLVFQHTESERNLFLYGDLDAEPVNPNPSPGNLSNILPPSNNFGYIAKSGAYFNSDVVTFYTKIDKPKKQTLQSLFAPPVQNFGLNIAGNFAALSFLANDIMIAPTTIEENNSTGPGTQKIDLLTVMATKSFAKQKENLMLLGITPLELQDLKSTTGLSNKHPKYIKFDKQNAFYIDTNGIPYFKVNLCVQGWDENGLKKVVTPTNKVVVYAKDKDSMWVSKAYSIAVQALKTVVQVVYPIPIKQNGISYVPLPNGFNYDLPPTQQLPNNYRIIGGSEKRGGDEDLKWAVVADSVKYYEQIDKDVRLYTVKELFDSMYLLMIPATAFDRNLTMAAGDFVRNFEINISNTEKYSNSYLDLSVSNSSNFINYIKEFGKDLENKLKLVNGDINLMPPIIYNENNKNFFRPKFSDKYNQARGLTILLNDTSSTVIKLEQYDYNPLSLTWNAILRVEILDHFGLDLLDIINYKVGKNETIKNRDRQNTLGLFKGFASWWILQHRKGFKPFITQVNVRCKISGVL